MIEYNECQKTFAISVKKPSSKEDAPVYLFMKEERYTYAKNASAPQRISPMNLDKEQLIAWVSGFESGIRECKELVSQCCIAAIDPRAKEDLEKIWARLHSMEKKAHLEAPSKTP